MRVLGSQFSVLGPWLITSALVLTGCATGRHDPHLAEQRRLETSVASLGAETARLRAELDSLVAQNDSLRRGTSRLEADVLERDEQIRAIRLELQRLKEIDLKPRKP